MRFPSLLAMILLLFMTSTTSAAPAGPRTPAAHAELLAKYQAERNPLLRPVLERAIDQAAAQRYGYISKLYWYTDLDEARAAAKAQRKPILSLRLLGQLDEELTCANSRFFRVMYYANAQISAYLRQHYILHWSSERQVPKVTVDFGDGRVIRTTVTGNSIHYVLDDQGRVLDYIPGMRTPSRFFDNLNQARALWTSVEAGPAEQRRVKLLAFHDQRAAAVRKAKRVTLVGPELDAQALAPTKLIVERPVVIALLPPGNFRTPSDATLVEWTRLGREIEFSWMPQAQESALIISAIATSAMPRSMLFDESSLQLMKRLQPDFALDALEDLIFADTAVSELVLRAGINQMPVELRFGAMEPLNRAVYDEVFLTRGDDPWLNMKALGGFSALPQ